MKTILITVENQEQVDAILDNLSDLEKEGTLDFAFNVQVTGQLFFNIANQENAEGK